MNLIEAFEYHRNAPGLARSKATIRNYRVYQEGFLDFLAEHQMAPHLSALNVQVVAEYQRWLRSKSLGKRGGAVAEKQAVMVLKACSRLLWDREILDADPLARLRVPRPPRIQRKPFTPDEAKRLVQAATAGANPIRDRALLLLMFDSGCRIGELMASTLADLDMQEGHITFRKTKGGVPRTVFLRVASRRDGGPCLAALKQWLKVREAKEGVEHLFTSREGYALSSRRVRELFAEWGMQARIPNAHPHRTRHTAASQFLGQPGYQGAEIQLRNRLGHVSHGVLADYVTLSDPARSAAAEVASLSSRWEL